MRDIFSGSWVRDYGALVVSVLVFLGSIATLVVSLWTRHKDWQRSVRLPRYAELNRSASAYFHARVTLYSDAAEGKRLIAACHTAFVAAVAEVLIVGPAPVHLAASILSEVMREVNDHPGDTDHNLTLFNLAMNDYIEAASAALALSNDVGETDYAQWKARKMSGGTSV